MTYWTPKTRQAPVTQTEISIISIPETTHGYPNELSLFWTYYISRVSRYAQSRSAPQSRSCCKCADRWLAYDPCLCGLWSVHACDDAVRWICIKITRFDGKNKRWRLVLFVCCNSGTSLADIQQSWCTLKWLQCDRGVTQRRNKEQPPNRRCHQAVQCSVGREWTIWVDISLLITTVISEIISTAIITFRVRHAQYFACWIA